MYLMRIYGWFFFYQMIKHPKLTFSCAEKKSAETRTHTMKRVITAIVPWVIRGSLVMHVVLCWGGYAYLPYAAAREGDFFSVLGHVSKQFT